MKKICAIALLLVLVSCSSTPPICESEGAKEAGFSQAIKGQGMNLSVGDFCREKDRVSFRKSFEIGYLEGQAKFCEVQALENIGRLQGEKGNPNAFSEETLKICSNKAELRGMYERGYLQGLANYCSEKTSRQLGFTPGAKGLQSQFTPEKFVVCGPSKVMASSTAFEQGYREGLKKYCSAEGISEEAFNEGAMGNDKTANFTQKFTLCSAERRKQIEAVYDNSYVRGFAQYCSPAQIDAEAIARAKESESANLPVKFARCFAKFPELTTRYTNTFNEERKKLPPVETLSPTPN